MEFDPEVLGKKPDLRIKFGDTWIYVEESSLEMSKLQKVVTFTMDHISKVIEKVSSSMNIEVSLAKRELSYEEVNEISNRIIEQCNETGQPQESNIEGIAKIFTYGIGQKKPLIEEKRPALGLSCLRVGSVECHLNVIVPFTDERVDKILKEKKQLSPEECNMIILDISMIPANLKIWSELIGAVLLIQKSLTIKSLTVNASLVVHPNARNPLPMGFIQLTNDYFRRSLEYPYRVLKPI